MAQLQELLQQRERVRAKRAVALARGILPPLLAQPTAEAPAAARRRRAPETGAAALAPLRSPAGNRTLLSRRDATTRGLARHASAMVCVRVECAGAPDRFACGIVLSGYGRHILTTSAAAAAAVGSSGARVTVRRVRTAPHAPLDRAHAAQILAVSRECGCALLTTASASFWTSRSAQDAFELGDGWASSEARDYALLAPGTSVFLAGQWHADGARPAAAPPLPQSATSAERPPPAECVVFARATTDGWPALVRRGPRAGASTLAHAICAGACVATTPASSGGGAAFDRSGRFFGMVVPALEDGSSGASAAAPPLVVPLCVLRCFVRSAAYARAAALPYAPRRTLGGAALQPMCSDALRRRHGVGSSHAGCDMLVTHVSAHPLRDRLNGASC